MALKKTLPIVKITAYNIGKIMPIVKITHSIEKK